MTNHLEAQFNCFNSEKDFMRPYLDTLLPWQILDPKQ